MPRLDVVEEVAVLLNAFAEAVRLDADPCARPRFWKQVPGDERVFLRALASMVVALVHTLEQPPEEERDTLLDEDPE